MAFPGELNINYYKGDTYEFSIYPKNADGSAMDLTNYLPQFSISEARGDLTPMEQYAIIPSDNPNHVKCVIVNSDAGSFANIADPSKTYYYDVEIRHSQTLPYKRVYTLLTGSITVSEQVSRPI